MGDGGSILTVNEARHLLRRTGFGARPKDVNRIINGHWTRSKAVNWILTFNPSKFVPRGESISDARDKWLRYMVRHGHPIQEKLVLFWHDHFSTGVTTVGNTDRMVNQNGLLRQFCKGDFKAMVKAINKDPAMMRYLDTQTNSKSIPNENYSRELQELFTLGVDDFAGNPNYLQEDIVQIARAFTGWRYNSDNFVSLSIGQHDFKSQYPERGNSQIAEPGNKVIYTGTGQFGAGGQAFDANGEGANEIDTVVDIIFSHRDSDMKNTVARYIAKKLVTYFAHPAPPADDLAATADFIDFVDDLITASGFDTTFNVEGLLRAMFVDDRFYLSAAPPVSASSKKSVKWPVDFVIGTVRVLNLKTKYKSLNVQGGQYRSLSYHISQMGQVLFDPPSVFGWDWETAWLSTVSMLAHYSFARDVGAARPLSDVAHSLRTDKLIDLTLTNPGAIVDAVTNVLGITDQMTSTARDILIDYLTDNNPNAIVNLNESPTPTTRYKKLHGLFALALQSPAYETH